LEKVVRILSVFFCSPFWASLLEICFVTSLSANEDPTNIAPSFRPFFGPGIAIKFAPPSFSVIVFSSFLPSGFHLFLFSIVLTMALSYVFSPALSGHSWCGTFPISERSLRGFHVPFNYLTLSSLRSLVPQKAHVRFLFLPIPFRFQFVVFVMKLFFPPGSFCTAVIQICSTLKGPLSSSFPLNQYQAKGLTNFALATSPLNC